MTTPAATLSGSCLCGEVRYTVTGRPVRFYHCHCSRCRKATGTGHASNLFLQGTLHWDQGASMVHAYKVPEAERFTNSFCSRCGSRLPRAIAASGLVMVPAGSLDQEPGLAPQARIFQDSRAEWSCDERSLPTFDNYPPSG